MYIVSSAKNDYFMYMSDPQLSPFRMNLPTALKDALAEQAKRNNRSLSGEIISRLEQSLSKFHVDEHGDLEVKLDEHQSKLLASVIENEKRGNELQRQLDELRRLIEDRD